MINVRQIEENEQKIRDLFKKIKSWKNNRSNKLKNFNRNEKKSKKEKWNEV